MSNWDKFKGNEESSKRPPNRLLSGTFGCQVCFEDVTEAEYFYTDGVLKWKCSQGHVSFADNFWLA